MPSREVVDIILESPAAGSAKLDSAAPIGRVFSDLNGSKRFTHSGFMHSMRRRHRSCAHARSSLDEDHSAIDEPSELTWIPTCLGKTLCGRPCSSGLARTNQHSAAGSAKQSRRVPKKRHHLTPRRAQPRSLPAQRRPWRHRGHQPGPCPDGRHRPCRPALQHRP